MDRRSLAAAVFDRSHLTGSFLLRSGQVSSEYFDKYRFEADPRLLRALAEALAELVPEGTEVLAGLELGGVPLAVALGQVTGLPCAFVRKAAKPYGTRKVAEGSDVEGRRVLVIEDVVTSGGQVVASTADLRELGAEVDHALCVIDRQAGGPDALAAVGVALRPLFTMQDLKAAAGR
ncbi:MAG: orotate phosphoribosyltransferase [Nocardiopsis sp. BM-2018]|nr:MAG: orotate phosphoribosyltransferase [Nocardiopsis sp. BM-2018]